MHAISCSLQYGRRNSILISVAGVGLCNSAAAFGQLWWHVALLRVAVVTCFPSKFDLATNKSHSGAVFCRDFSYQPAWWLETVSSQRCYLVVSMRTIQCPVFCPCTLHILWFASPRLPFCSWCLAHRGGRTWCFCIYPGNWGRWQWSTPATTYMEKRSSFYCPC